MTDKQAALETINKLPEDASMDEIAEELQILAGIRKGKEDIKAGRMKTHVEVEQLVEAWISR